jgi:hypothetical protein
MEKGKAFIRDFLHERITTASVLESIEGGCMRGSEISKED